MKKLSLPLADVNAKQQRGVRRSRCDELQRLLCMWDEGSIVCKEKVHEQPLRCHGVGLEAE